MREYNVHLAFQVEVLLLFVKLNDDEFLSIFTYNYCNT